MTATLFGTFNVPVVKETRYKIKCPHEGCDGEFDITYQINEGDKTFGSWSCKKCGWKVSGEQVGPESVRLTALNSRVLKTLVLLVFEGTQEQAEPVYLIVNGMAFQEEGKVDLTFENNEYFYEQHTCPWNYLRATVMEGNDTDPHGIFSYVETVLTPKDWDEHNMNSDKVRALFEHFKGRPNFKPKTIFAIEGKSIAPQALALEAKPITPQ